eukprot:TRINITY_DN1191_c0_g1_i3.p1 TRINITY_DN1191_c0_g1~~TRINITY_DN1191_c0_g1_i3.p1  ORF type:complete len:996 (+),score=215.68 TRINITY_DN1191_c0_g1_i3:1908-4895(+)
MQLQAHIFDGFRIDNCHSVPLPVLQYLISEARLANRDLVVLAELFSSSFEAFQSYTSSCGIHAILKEAINATSPAGLSHILFESGGPLFDPIGEPEVLWGPQPAVPYPVKSWIFDVTHDNEPLFRTRPEVDALPLAASVAMCSAVTGSVRGFDELLPHKVDVVLENRKYPIYRWDKAEVEHTLPGIMAVKAHLNALHRELAVNGYNEVYAESTGPLVNMARHNPVLLQTIHMVTHPAYYGSAPPAELPPVKVTGEVFEIRFAGTLVGVPPPWTATQVERAQRQVGGLLEGRRAQLQFDLAPTFDQNPYVTVELDRDSGTSTLRFQQFPPGSIVCFASRLPQGTQAAMHSLNALLEACDGTGARPWDLFDGVDLLAMNILMYRSDEEEHAETGHGAYDVPGLGKLPYCGLQGWETIIREVTHRHPIDMGHPLLNHLRGGDWAIDYITNRMKQCQQLDRIRQWITRAGDCIKALPRYLVPKFFFVVISSLHRACVEWSLSQMSSYVQNADTFAQRLALTSLQVCGSLKSSPLVSPDVLSPPNCPDNVTLAAGLPHFCHGYMRSWGRDTFISLKGLLLITGRFKEAHDILCGFACSLRHGLIPNLLDGGRNPRFNARDAAWWFLNALLEYCLMAPCGTAIMEEKVHRIFPSEACPSQVSSMADVVQEILTSHANGIHFREWNAGPKIDDKMQDAGFNVDVTLDQHTGFIFGGNQNNCGTWMDKMGESKQAGNYGTPATPRDGAAIEIVALSYKVLTQLAELHKHGSFPYSSVPLHAGDSLSYADWASRIETNFHRHFFVPLNPAEDTKYDIEPSVVNVRGIYKDTYGGSLPFANYQLRPNCCVAFSLAPALFAKHPKELATALRTVEERLAGPLGMCTLNKEDWAYRGIYNSDDSTEYNTAKGFSYHQGPEWVWIFGYFLQAVVVSRGALFGGSTGKTRHHVHSLLGPHIHHLVHSPWESLPELTNADGAVCPGSCPCQAWSVACIQEALYMLQQCSV